MNNKQAIEHASIVSGIGKMEITRIMADKQIADPLFAACYSYCSGLAVNITGDRERWNMRRAAAMKLRLEQLS